MDSGVHGDKQTRNLSPAHNMAEGSIPSLSAKPLLDSGHLYYNIPMRKKLSERVHAKRRLVERYGLELNRRELRELVSQIQEAKATHIETQSNRVSLWRVSHGTIEIVVVYDKKRGTIVTALPASDRRNKADVAQR